MRCIGVTEDGSAGVWVAKDSQEWRDHVTDRRLREARERVCNPLLADQARERSERESCRRSRKEAEDFASAHRLGILATLTFPEPCRSWDRAWASWSRFEVRLLQVYPQLVAVVMAEPHPDGHGWHLHFLCNRFVHVKVLRALWRAVLEHQGEHLICDIRAGGKGRRPLTPGRRARYIAKYIGKSSDPQFTLEMGVRARRKGQWRYRRVNGCLPAREVQHFDQVDQALAWALGEMGEPNRIRHFQVEGAGLRGRWLYWPEEAWGPPPPTLGGRGIGGGVA